jgi:uncharacterized oxidoreductase
VRLGGKQALVTGGTDGIGLEIARQLKAKGTRVAVVGRRAELLDRAQAEGLEGLPGDLSSAEGCAALVAAWGDRPLDLLVNNAGASPPFEATGDPQLAATDRVIFLNLNAPLHLMAAFRERLAAAKGTIVNVTSGLAIAPRAGGPVYCATKAGLRSLTLGLRPTYKALGIHLIEALPPVVDTAMTAARPAKGKMSAPDCAAEIVAAIEQDRDEANVGMVKLLRRVYSVSPALARRIMLRF